MLRAALLLLLLITPAAWADVLVYGISTSEAVSVTGTPRLALQVGGATRYATYNPVSSTAVSLVFGYTISTTDGGVVSLTSPIDLNGGSIADAAGNPLGLTFSPSPTPLVQVVGGAPLNIAAPTISGVTYVSNSLTCTSGSWSGTPSPTYAYQWQANGSNIGGATSNTYVMISAYEGQPMRCVVTASNGAGTVSATSNILDNWVPSDISSSLALWLDAADFSTISISTGVSEWRDKSGNGRNLTAMPARPTYAANGLNNRPALSWPASGQTGMTWTGAAFNPVRTFGVARYEGANPFGQTSGFMSYNFAGLSDIFLAGTADRWLFDRLVFLNGSEPSSDVALPAVAAPFLWVDNMTPTAGRTTIWIGNDRGGASPAWRGKISEVVITLFEPTLQDRRTIEGYLAWKWGLTDNLPGGHPYKTVAP